MIKVFVFPLLFNSLIKCVSAPYSDGNIQVIGIMLNSSLLTHLNLLNNNHYVIIITVCCTFEYFLLANLSCISLPYQGNDSISLS